MQQTKMTIQNFLSRQSLPHGWRKEILQQFSVDELIAHLRSATDERTKSLLITVFGFEHVYQAADCIAEFFDDESTKVRYEAADMLAHLVSQFSYEQLDRYGKKLYSTFCSESEGGTKLMQVAVLGALRYLPAASDFVPLLKSDDPSARGSAAWSLGNMSVQTALDDLTLALAKETEWYPKTRLQEAVDIIKFRSKYKYDRTSLERLHNYIYKNIPVSMDFEVELAKQFTAQQLIAALVHSHNSVVVTCILTVLSPLRITEAIPVLEYLITYPYMQDVIPFAESALQDLQLILEGKDE